MLETNLKLNEEKIRSALRGNPGNPSGKLQSIRSVVLVVVKTPEQVRQLEDNQLYTVFHVISLVGTGFIVLLYTPKLDPLANLLASFDPIPFVLYNRVQLSYIDTSKSLEDMLMRELKVECVRLLRKLEQVIFSAFYTTEQYTKCTELVKTLGKIEERK